MTEEKKISEAVDRIVGLGQEVDAPGVAAVDEPSLALARELLRQWIDGIKGVVVNPAMGRVTVIDATGRPSSIASADLAHRMGVAGITQSG
jgi:Asp/Glu/hydantoin racemase